MSDGATGVQIQGAQRQVGAVRITIEEKACRTVRDWLKERGIQRGSSLFQRVESRNSIYYGKGNVKWNTTKERMHLTTDSSKDWLNVEEVAEICAG